ncbi:MAG: hypothetical protein MI673_00290, partial [Thiotrichales bacterium]|nr:hypothetical protein [Thiotrichales bacterium]
MRVALGIEYNGCGFNGWQSQDHGRTVQDCVEAALSFVADEHISVQCAGRTDTGVHALHQVVHFDTVARREPHEWVFGVNSRLDSDVNLLSELRKQLETLFVVPEIDRLEQRMFFANGLTGSAWRWSYQ